MSIRYLNYIATLFALALTVYTLSIGRDLLLPLAIALVFWYIIVRITALFQKPKFFKRSLPFGIALFCAIVITAITIYLFSMLFTYSIGNIMSQSVLYQDKLQEIVNWINRLIGKHLDLKQMIANINLSHLFSTLALIVSSIASNFSLIVVYLVFLLLEYQSFNGKLKSICKTEEKFQKTRFLIDKIDHDVNNYLKIKTVVNAIAGFLSYLLLWLVGIEYAEFWGVLVFLLHYIPFFGPLVAVLLILLAISIQVIHLIPFIAIGVLLVLIQILMGNVLEPKWMGTKLNLSPLVILLALAFWGKLWGIMGMFLCVPLMVIINIILAKFPRTHAVAMMLSATGKIDTTKDKS